VERSPPQSAQSPVWSPDGGYLAFNIDRKDLTSGSGGFHRLARQSQEAITPCRIIGEHLASRGMHVLPRGFVRIRHFGFLAHRHRAKLFDSDPEYRSTSPSNLSLPHHVDHFITLNLVARPGIL
jgi:hypothetical protein